MGIDSVKLNMFSQASAMQAINPTKAVNGKSSAAVAGGTTSNNPFSSSLFKGDTVGLNQMQTGASVFTPAQAGKAAGVSRFIGIA
jgi:hypothetical protein